MHMGENSSLFVPIPISRMKEAERKKFVKTPYKKE